MIKGATSDVSSNRGRVALPQAPRKPNANRLQHRVALLCDRLGLSEHERKGIRKQTIEILNTPLPADMTDVAVVLKREEFFPRRIDYGDHVAALSQVLPIHQLQVNDRLSIFGGVREADQKERVLNQLALEQPGRFLFIPTRKGEAETSISDVMDQFSSQEFCFGIWELQCTALASYKHLRNRIYLALHDEVKRKPYGEFTHCASVSFRDSEVRIGRINQSRGDGPIVIRYHYIVGGAY